MAWHEQQHDFRARGWRVRANVSAWNPDYVPTSAVMLWLRSESATESDTRQLCERLVTRRNPLQEVRSYM